MHTTVVKMKDGRVFEGPLWTFKPLEGWLSLVGDETMPDRLYFAEMESATTFGERVGILPGGGPRIEDEDLLAKAQRYIEEALQKI